MPRLLGRSMIFLLLAILPSLAHPATAAVDRWTPLGPDGGTIQTLAVDPGNPGTLYAGSEGGGVWKSTDGGVHWRSASEGLTVDGFGASEVFALAVAPGDSDTVFADTRGGLFRSTDGGASWSLALSHEQVVTGSLAVSPDDPSRILAGVQYQLWTSDDGGATWSQILETRGSIEALVFAPDDPSTVYAAAGTLLVSRDAGSTWTPLTNAFGELPRKAANNLAIDPSNPRILYAGTDTEGVWKSKDRGATWKRLPGSGINVQSLVLDPSDPRILLAGVLGSGLLRSDNAGGTWRQVKDLPATRVLALAADPGLPGTLWLGSEDRGVFRSRSSGRRWSPSREGLAATHLYAAAFDPFQERTLYASARTLGVHRSTDAGNTWDRINAGLEVPHGLAVNALVLAPHPARPGTLFAGTGNGIYRTQDRGAHWSFQRTPTPGGVRTFAFQPLNPDALFAAGSYIFRSRTGGRTWRELPFPETSYESTVRELVIAPLRPQTLFLLDYTQRHGDPRGLFRSTDGGATWHLVFDRGPAALAPHPTLPGVLYVATQLSNEIWKSEDDGVTWNLVTEIIAGNPVQLTALLVDRLDPSILYLGTFDDGVLRSTDGGATWAPLGAGMIAEQITCLEADPRNPRHLVACTWGGGLLEIRLQP